MAAHSLATATAAELRAMADEALATCPGLTIAGEHGAEQPAAAAMAEADAQAERATNLARAIVAYANAMKEPAA